jgi:hypothetical protein
MCRLMLIPLERLASCSTKVNPAVACHGTRGRHGADDGDDLPHRRPQQQPTSTQGTSLSKPRVPDQCLRGKGARLPSEPVTIWPRSTRRTCPTTASPFQQPPALPKNFSFKNVLTHPSLPHFSHQPANLPVPIPPLPSASPPRPNQSTTLRLPWSQLGRRPTVSATAYHGGLSLLRLQVP